MILVLVTELITIHFLHLQVQYTFHLEDLGDEQIDLEDTINLDTSRDTTLIL